MYRLRQHIKNGLQLQAATKERSEFKLQSWNTVVNFKCPRISPDAPQIGYAKASACCVIIT
jgi:hypothetical protein